MKKNKPNILYFDIETSPLLVWTHYIGSKVSIYPQQIHEPKKIICICYSWNNEKKVHELHWDPKKEGDGKDSKMLKEFNKIAKQADYLVAYNGQGFDVKEIRSEIALRGHAEAWCGTPVLDPLKDYRRSFRFVSNKLDAVAKALKLESKNPMSMEDWIEVTLGNKAALNKMIKYCKQDVRVLRNVHQRLEPYVDDVISHTRLKGLQTSPLKACMACSSARLVKYGMYTYKKQARQKYLCKDCYKVNCN